MLQVGKLVAQGVHEARVFERARGRRMPESDPDRPIREADAVTALDVGSLRFEYPVAKTKP